MEAEELFLVAAENGERLVAMMAVASAVTAFAFAEASSCAVLMEGSGCDVSLVAAVSLGVVSVSSFCPVDGDATLAVFNWAEFACPVRD
ncbi:hypothetical protein LWC05_09830 [Acetobacter sicerae]|uniref:Secreted protein n=1 Tax=Acetobacter sicerae TaxID=85325 RepID=A0ABS8VVG4_9PROT|nr:hypothetical protein [Acetobacter sicerae]MCE0744179.1 hypothetical protein [Acetobacter sicerae]